MNRSSDHGSCASVRELIPWAATKHLSPVERERVETHAAACPRCAELLALVREVALQTGADGEHPPAEVLVRLAEGDLPDAERRRWDDHLSRCEACRASLEVLQRVDHDLVPPVDEPTPGDADAPAASRPPKGETDTSVRSHDRGRWRAAWTALPVAAMLLLAVALLNGRRQASPVPGPAVLPVVILDDETAAVRGTEQRVPPAMVDGSRATALLLEFTSLAEQPAAAARYRVSVRSADGDVLRWEQSVTGADFRDNYTLMLTMPAGVLSPGDYHLTVTDTRDVVVYRSRFSVR